MAAAAHPAASSAPLARFAAILEALCRAMAAERDPLSVVLHAVEHRLGTPRSPKSPGHRFPGIGARRSGAG